ncbi:hypothetical protein ACWD04_21125 [Streptomyces sp. NPDC002911]
MAVLLLLGVRTSWHGVEPVAVGGGTWFGARLPGRVGARAGAVVQDGRPRAVPSQEA